MRREVVLVITAFLVAACVRNQAGVLPPTCVFPPSAHSSRTQRSATSPTTSSDEGQLTVFVVAGDSTRQTLDEVLIDVAPLDGDLSAATQPIRMQNPGTRGTYALVTRSGRFVLLVRRVGYEVQRDTVAVRAGFSDTLDLHLRPMCVGF